MIRVPRASQRYDYIDHVTGEQRRMSPLEPEADLSQVLAFDGLVVCSGTNTWASLPLFKGQELFGGRILHAENYKKPEVQPAPRGGG